MKMKLYHLLIVFLLCFAPALYGQVEQDTTKGDGITYEVADSADFFRDGEGVKYLRGNVVIRRDSTYMFCDSAIIMDTSIIAIGNVSILQDDTITIFADSLIYHPDSMVATLYGYEENNVVLQNGHEKLFTKTLHYDVKNKIARYNTGAVLESNRTSLRSKRGIYFVNDRLAKFYDKVLVQDSSFNLWADSMYYMTNIEKAIFRGPTRINIDSSRIFAEQGFYDIKNDNAEFEVNAQYEKGESRATADKITYSGKTEDVTLIGKARYIDKDSEIKADSLIHNKKTEISILIGNAEFKDSSNYASSDKIIYDGKKESFVTEGRSVVVDDPMIIKADYIDYNKKGGAGLARGNVIWQDTSANTTIFCDEIIQDTLTQYIKAYSFNNSRPLFENILDDDTLYLSADTLVSYQEEDQDSNNFFIAYHDVKIFKTDFMAICDSLSYKSVDSIFNLFYNPYMWADTTQFSGDTIDIVLKDKKIKEVIIKKNGFIIDTPDNQFFNQVSGRDINVYFDDNELRNMVVSGNAESLYYILDSENAYIGINKTTCSKINFIFKNKELKDILFYSKPVSKLTPMDKADHNALRLSGFNWNIANKPISLESIKIRKK
jgi:lipopolysaccharide export system protein LptA